MRAIIVIPCLDEEAGLAATCASIGFMPGRPPPPATDLVLVDNGSIDGTPEVMAALRHRFPDNVFVVREPERGYVPPRHRGVLMAQEIAERRRIEASDVLILQADADTIYGQGYVAAMRDAAICSGLLIEGVAQTDGRFAAANPGFFRLARYADSAVEAFFAHEADEVVIDDKVAAYRLEDYGSWGGHQREYDRHGDEIHAETSRLFIRARTYGARRVRAGSAVAFPSRRKLEIDPLLYFVTQGFPREAQWGVRWQEQCGRLMSLRDFDDRAAPEALKRAISVRRAHGLILFALMPEHIARLLDQPSVSVVRPPAFQALMSLVSGISRDDIRAAPGRLIEICFALLESDPELFEACVGEPS